MRQLDDVLETGVQTYLHVCQVFDMKWIVLDSFTESLTLRAIITGHVYYSETKYLQNECLLSQSAAAILITISFIRTT